MKRWICPIFVGICLTVLFLFNLLFVVMEPIQ